MKLVFAIKRLDDAAGGAERVLCTVASALVRRGHEVSIVSFDRPGGRAFYALDERVARIALGIGDVDRSARVGETLVRMRVLRRTLTGLRPDAVIAFMHSMFVPAAIALAGTRIPVVGSEHIVPEHYRSRPLQWLLLNLSAPLTARMTVLSDAVRSGYPRWVRRRMAIMPNPVETTPCEPARAGSDRAPIVLNVGRLDSQKDQATLVRAFAIVADEHPEWQLRIVGDGALRAELQALIERLDLDGRATLAGVVRAIDAEYLQAEIFALPSRYESFGLATAEAMMHGLPVVGFADCPGTNELVVDGDTGILVRGDSGREVALAAALRDLMDDRAKRRKLGVAGRLRAVRLFDVESVCDHWERLLRQLHA